MIIYAKPIYIIYNIYNYSMALRIIDINESGNSDKIPDKNRHIRFSKREESEIDKILRTFPLRIKGGILFQFKVRRALQYLHINNIVEARRILPVSSIISSRNIKHDEELGILYLDRSLSAIEFSDILNMLEDKKDRDRINSRSFLIGINRKKYPRFNKVIRKFFRQSLEKKLERAVINIITSPPFGKVATEDQHFLMTIIHLEMFTKKIAGKIEGNSIIPVLLKERKNLHQYMVKIQKSYPERSEKAQMEAISSMKEVLDSYIFKKRMIIQERLQDRILAGVKKWQKSKNIERAIYRNRHRLNKILPLIKRIEDMLDNLKGKLYLKNSFRAGILKRQIIRFRKKKIRLNYIYSVFEKQKDFAIKLEEHILMKREDALIPEGYVKSISASCFDFLRIFLNISFMGFYIYLIGLSLMFIPVFLSIGLFVFQPIANKFAILIMSAFVKNKGLKRLSAPQLYGEIEKRSREGKYFCTIDLPIFTGRTPELKTTAHYIKRNLQNLENTLDYYNNLSIYYQITSNTTGKALVDKEVKMVREIQKFAADRLGEGKVYFVYLHRKSTKAKKMGNIIAGHLFKYHGYTRPNIYTDRDRFLLTFDKGPFFDRAEGNFKDAICHEGNFEDNERIIQDILKGRKIDTKNNIEFTFFVDNKNEIKPGSLEKSLSIMMHPENKNITILQPQMKIEDPVSEDKKITSAFLHMMRIARDTHNGKYLNTLHGLYNNMSAYYGKGMVRLKKYDYMIMKEVLNIKYLDSHDWQESVFNNSVIAVSGNKNISISNIRSKRNSYKLLMESVDSINLFELYFKDKVCTVTDERGNKRTLVITAKGFKEKITEVISYLDNGIEVGERELISTIGNYTRDARWLKGDLQMFNTFEPYQRFMPEYHRFHLENIFRRLTGEILLFLWVLINFVFGLISSSSSAAEQGIMFMLTLYLAVTAFGFAGIDLFLYPIFFETGRRIRFTADSRLKRSINLIFKIFKKIISGTWQFILYILIAWPRVILGIKSNIRIMISGIDQYVDWDNASNASISTEEIGNKGIP